MSTKARPYKPLRRGVDPWAFTHRRTPKDVDGRRHDAPCIVLGQYFYGTPRRLSRKWYKIRFADGKIDLRHESNLYCNRRTLGEDGRWSPGVAFVGSHDSRSGSWWQSASGALERVATVYEKARSEAGDPPPSEGWALVEEAERVVAHYKTLPSIFGPGESETDCAERAERAAELRERREERAQHAAAMLRKHERALKRETRLVAKWKRISARAEARLATDGEREHEGDEGDES